MLIHELSGVYGIKWYTILIEPQSPLLVHIISVSLDFVVASMVVWCDPEARLSSTTCSGVLRSLFATFGDSFGLFLSAAAAEFLPSKMALLLLAVVPEHG
jgi:hypothetical protein